MSAGALLFPRRAIAWGSEIPAKGHRPPVYIQASAGRDQLGDGDVTFRMDRGPGLLDGVIVDVHFTEYGRQPRLAHALSLSRRTKADILGVGLDVNAAAILRINSNQGAAPLEIPARTLAAGI
jgi:cyanophycinase-like exopeptidase